LFEAVHTAIAVTKSKLNAADPMITYGPRGLTGYFPTCMITSIKCNSIAGEYVTIAISVTFVTV
jgi:hypothetical protein